MSGAVYSSDDAGTVVIDIGSNTIKVGYAGEDIPKFDIVSKFGHISENEENLVDTDQGSNVKPDKVNSFINSDLEVPRYQCEINSFMNDCMIDDWDVFEQVLSLIIKQQLKSEYMTHPVLMSEAAWNTSNKREKLCELMFEKFDIPAFFLCKNAVLSSFANGRTTALVFDSGATHSAAVPVYDGYALQNSIVKSPLAGDFVISECQKLLKEKEIDVVPLYMIGSKESVGLGQSPKWTKKDNIPDVTSSYHNSMVTKVLQGFVQNVLQVSDSGYKKEETDQFSDQHYQFPNGYNNDFGYERFELVERLFDPSIIKGGEENSMLSMTQVVTTSIGMCDADIKPSLFGNVIVTGGNTLINGFIDRLSHDLNAKVPPSMKLKLINPAANHDRRYSSWIGGSILASLGPFQQKWISKFDYKEEGKSCVEKRCP